MKKTLFTLALAVMSGAAVAQLPAYGVAPDFTITDLDGIPHNLYDLLDEGKPVVIDLYAEWCGPCWSYHQSGNLENLYTQYGPDGTDQLVVWGVETDGQTPATAISGGAGSTSGWNWLDGIEYPMANDNSLGNIFNQAYYPTIVTICPDRSVTETGQRTTASHYAFANACASLPTAATDRALKEYTGDVVSCGGGGAAAMSVVLWNQGTTDALTSATIKVMDGATEVSSTPWSGNLAPYAATGVSLGNVAVGPGTYTIVISETDANMSNNTLSVTLGSVAVATINVVVELTTDFYPGETSWDIRNSSGAVVASESYTAGPEQSGGGGADANITHAHPVTLPMNECFTVNLSDDYGDGIQQYTGQPLLDFGIKVIADWGGVIVAQNGDFEDEASAAMKTDGTSSIDEATLSSTMNVYPNPATDNTLVTFNTNDKSSIRIELLNAVGARVMIKDFGSMNAGTQMIPVSTSNLSSGIYLINVYVNDSVITKRLSVEE